MSIPKALQRLKPGVSIEWNPDGSVEICRPGKGIERHEPNSDMASGLRSILGPLAPRPMLKETVEVQIVDVDPEQKVVTLSRRWS